MKFSLTILLFLAVFAKIESAPRDYNSKPLKVVCYWGSWSYYRPGDGKFEPENIDPYICTHLIYGFAKLNYNNQIDVYDKWLDIKDPFSGGLDGYRRFNSLREKNKELKTLIAIGGWNEGSIKYSKMAENAASRKVFIDSVIEFLQKYGFNGLDLDWEYPASRGGNPTDKQNFVLLIKELKAAFGPHGYLLTAAVSAGKPTIDKAYDIPELSNFLDFINVMAYDFHGAWEHVTGHNAPLYPKASDSQQDRDFTVEYSIDYYINNGADPKKLVMGMPLYGRTFTLAGSDSGFKARTIGAGGNPGPFTRQPGTLGYNEICVMLNGGGWNVHRDDTYKVPYAVKGNQWIGYDDVQSIGDKVDFLKSRRLGGGMVWSLETDDFRGKCGSGAFPLIKTISSRLNNDNSQEHTEHQTKRPIMNPMVDQMHDNQSQTFPTISPIKNFTPQPVNDNDLTCTNVGFFPDPHDKSKLNGCTKDENGNFIKLIMRCGPGTIYDSVFGFCAWRIDD